MNRQSAIRQSGIVLSVFAVLGVGLGLAGYFALDSVATGGDGGSLAAGILFLSLSSIIYLLGPTIAGVVGLMKGLATADQSEAIAVSAVGSFVGFYVFGALALGIMLLAMPSGDGAGGGGSSISWGLLLKIGIPAGLIGLLTGAIGNRFDFG